MYLWSLITEDEIPEKEVERRIMIARTTLTNMRNVLSCRGINLKMALQVEQGFLDQHIHFRFLVLR